MRAPFKSYLRTYLKQYENVHVSPGAVSEADKETLLAAAFEKYYAERTLLGTPAKCARLVERLAALGVDEVACLVDFGVEADLGARKPRRAERVARALRAGERGRRMKDLSSRLSALTPEQRTLFEARLKQKSLTAPTDAAGHPAPPRRRLALLRAVD